jgi:hypothetical protein
MPYFNIENGIPSTIPVRVRLPHLPLRCWNVEIMRSIGNSIGTYIDKVDPKDEMLEFARICVEVDLEKGLSEYFQLTSDK